MPFIEGMIMTIKGFPFSVKDAESFRKRFESFPEPRVFKTHLTFEMVPKGCDEETKPRYIYVMRNPKDTFVSIYHHLHNMPYIKDKPTWDVAFARFMKGDGKLEKGLLNNSVSSLLIIDDEIKSQRL